MKKENYILVVGIILCGFISNSSQLDPSLVIRHIAWCIMTVLLCGCLFLKQRKNLSVLNTLLFAFFLAYCAITTISIVKADNPSESLYFILMAWVSLIFFVCVASVIDKKIIIKALVCMGLCFAIYGLHDIVMASMNNGIKSTPGLGFATGRNLWSSSLLLLLPFSLYSAAKKNKIAIIAVILLLINIILLQTRSVYAALFVSAFISLVVYKKKLAVLLVVVVLLCVPIFDRLRGTGSLSYRLQSWNKSVKTFCDEPMLGVGAGNWKTAVPRYGNVIKYDKSREIFLQRAHNDFIEVFTETGIFGGLCYLSIFTIAIHYSRRAIDKTLAWSMRFGITSYMVFAFFSFPRERAIHSILLLVMIALIVKECPHKENWCEKRNIKTFSVCTAIILLALFVNYHRYATERYCRKMLVAKANKDWGEVLKIINENYTPYSTMLGHAVTPILQYRAEANFYLNNQSAAYSDYLSAYRNHPNHAAILTNIGSYKIRERKFKEALYFYDRANTVMPGLPVITEPLSKLREIEVSWR